MRRGVKVEVMEYPGDRPAGMMFPIMYELDGNLWPTGGHHTVMTGCHLLHA
jgi:hypothetical protein